ncbi:MAG: VTT domain-containing protein [Clostridia bacterium]|nr:VTT domain-containing protein [Clostridia bacterium]
MNRNSNPTNKLTNKRTLIIKILIIILIIACVTVPLYFLFKYLGITDIEKLQLIIKNCGNWGWIVFLLLQILCTSILCFVPAVSMTFITVGIILFGANWKTFLLCFSGVILASIIMDLIGRFGGSKLIVKLIGQKSYDDALVLIQTKGIVYVPVFYLLPVFPDDAICMICGSLRVKFWIHLIEIFLCRGIGCATIVFGISILPTDLISALKTFDTEFIFAHLWDYITMITVLIFWIIVLLFVARKIDIYLTNKIHENDNV